MRTTYRVLAYLIALAVLVQAAGIALAIAGLFTWVAKGGTLDAAVLESGALDFPGLVGFIVHGMNGMFVIPALALALLVVAFFAKVPRGILWAGALVVLIAVQILLGIARVPELAMLHGVNALIVFTIALVAGFAARSVPTVAPATQAATGSTV